MLQRQFGGFRGMFQQGCDPIRKETEYENTEQRDGVGDLISSSSLAGEWRIVSPVSRSTVCWKFVWWDLISNRIKGRPWRKDTQAGLWSKRGGI